MRTTNVVFLLFWTLFGSGLSAAETPTNSRPTPRLSPLLAPPSQPTRNSWGPKRRKLLDAWQKVLGPFPAKPPLKTEILGTEELPEFLRQHIQYQVENGKFVDGYLLTPPGARGKLPGIVVFHATTPFGARGAAGLEAEYPETKRQGVLWVKQGYIVWCPRNYINTEGTNWSGNAVKVMTEHPGWTGMTRMTWDAIRAADFMESLPQVDKKKIACFGHSLGAKEVLYAMAFDPRYCAGVSSEGGIGLGFSNWDAVWYLGPKIRQPGWNLEHHQLLALIAPRPFLLLGGDSADDDRSQVFIEAARPIYSLFGTPHALRYFNHRQGHVYEGEGRRVAEDFLGTYLK